MTNNILDCLTCKYRGYFDYHKMDGKIKVPRVVTLSPSLRGDWKAVYCKRSADCFYDMIRDANRSCPWKEERKRK